MLASQRQHFCLDEDVIYLDSAALSPLAMNVERVAIKAATAKTRPWLRDRAVSRSSVDTLRTLAAGLIGAQPEDMAIVCSVSYGLAVAAANLPTGPGERVLVLEGDHTSQALTWAHHARRNSATLEVVARPPDSDWTAAILAHIRRPDPHPIAVAALAANFWSDGAIIDLAPICRELKQKGAYVVIDATQAVGIMPIDVLALQADFVAFPMYKWLLGPFSLAFVYVAPRWQDGEPLEQNGFNRKTGATGQREDAGTAPYLDGARRFDMGQRDTFIGIPTAIASLSMVHEWNRADVAARLQALTGRLANHLAQAGIACVPEALRSPHILGVKGLPAGTAEACREKNVFLSQRNDSIRISPHVFNTEADMDRCGEALLSIHAASRSTAAGASLVSNRRI